MNILVNKREKHEKTTGTFVKKKKNQLSVSFVVARQRHLSLHLREDPGDGATVADAEKDQPDQD